jgi:hypothetical protein
MGNIFENLREWLLEPLMGQPYAEKKKDIEKRRKYRRGDQKAPLKGGDDCIIVNFTGLIVDRCVSQLFGKEIKFDLPGEDDAPESLYINQVWRANHKQRLLKAVATYGAEAGTCYIKILPDRAMDEEGKPVPRLISIDPASVQMETEEEDCETVIRYTIGYTIHDEATDKDIARKQVIERGARLVDEYGFVIPPVVDTSGHGDASGAVPQPEGRAAVGWVIQNYHSEGDSRWILDSEVMWEWDFAPLIHWKNMPENGSAYGRPDVTDDIMDLQDKFNFVISNTGKIIKFHAHPKTWGKLFGKAENATWGVDDMLLSNNPEAHLENLEMESDLGSSLNFIRFLRQALFDIARSVDIDSLADKLGALTNFALRVLYQDAMDKLEDKRGSYGEALVAINHALLELAGMGDTDGGEVIWPEVLPLDEIGQANALSTDMNLGLVSKQTASDRRGYVWVDEEDRIAKEKQEGDNVGAALLRAFGQGK